jgi:hypothetical protein
MICPNVSSKEWKSLVNKVGKEEALRLFAENNYEIPLNYGSVSKPIFKDDSGTEKFGSVHTKSLLSKNPSLAEKIINRLKELYPEVNISKNGLLDADGKWVEIQPGEKGMHMRNAFQSVVAWANDSYLETPPHEYAHHYIDMFRNTPLVREGIEKYGEERLATIMGRYYTQQEVSGSFKKWSDRFWNMVRSLFGSKDVADILSTKFYEGERLTTETFVGKGEVQYQKDDDWKLDVVEGFTNVRGDLEEEVKDIKVISTAEAKKGIKDNIISRNNYSETQVDNKTSSDIFSSISAFIQNYEVLKGNKELNGINSNVISQVKDILNASGEEYRTEIASDLKSLYSGLDEQLSNEIASKKIFDFLNLAYKHSNYLAKINDSIIVDTNKIVPKKNYNSVVKEEVDNTLRTLKERYDSAPAWLSSTFKVIEKGASFLMGPRLAAKYLSGGTETAFSEIMYKGLNKAEEVRVNILNKFDNMISMTDEVKEGSAYLSAAKKIEDVSGKTFKVQRKTGQKGQGDFSEMKLSDDEIIQMYLTLRQTDKGQFQGLSPKEVMYEKGWSLSEETILDRGIMSTDSFVMSESLNEQINEYVEENFAEYIQEIDAGMDYLYDNANEMHKVENGLDLTKVENYFPVHHQGQKQFKFDSASHLINEYRGIYTRTGSGSAIKISGASKTINQHKVGISLYSSYSVPLSNSEKVINGLQKYKEKNAKRYIEHLEGHLKRLGNLGLAVSSVEAEKTIQKISNKITGNYSVAALGFNVPVMFKQPISYLMAKTHIDTKYLKEAGWGIGGIAGVNPKEIFKQLTIVGDKPLTWKFDETDATYLKIIELSPKLAFRLRGNSSRETGEAFLESNQNDLITLPIKKDGKKIQLSKKRFMEGIRIFDSATVMTIWKAAELEAQDKYGLDPVKDKVEFDQYVKAKAEKVIELTQPTYDLNNRSEAQSLNDPLIRILTMFGSARSKIGMQMIEAVYDAMLNPSKENMKILRNRSINALVLTSTVLASINLAKGMLIYGFDEPEDELLAPFKRDLILSATGGFFGVGDVTRLLYTRFDDAPWAATLDHPLQLLVEGYADGVAGVLSGDFDRGSKKLVNAIFQTTGLPTQLWNMPHQVISNR